MIVRVNVVLNKTVVDLTVTDVLTTCAVVIFRVKVSCITSDDGIKLWLDWLAQSPSTTVPVSGLRSPGRTYLTI